MENQWLLDRCREVQANPDGYLDLWAREHYKSTIITFGLSIQDILNDPEVTIGIFSHTRPIAKAFLSQIKRELEDNIHLKAWFNDILYQNSSKESPRWSEDNGLIVKRKSNPKESTVEAWGLVDAQPTSKHFTKMIFDDTVEQKSVGSPDMMQKTTDAWALAQNLGARGGTKRHAGTRYHFNDTYGELIRRGALKLRMHPATEDGTPLGKPVFLTRDELDKKRRDQGPYIFACQQLQNPVADNAQGFKPEWIRHYGPSVTGDGMNKYILVDPASEKKKTSDYTSMWVVGLAEDGNYYWLDMVRDRLNLKERGDTLFRLHRKWRPLAVGYEKYGVQADIEHFKERMDREQYTFDIIPLGGQIKKNDRIRRMIPLYEQHKMLLPETCNRTNYEGKTEDLVTVFIEEEYKAFPVSLHDDMMDGQSRIEDEEFKKHLVWPMANKSKLDPTPCRISTFG